MNEWIIYYNPKCGSCRKVKERLEERGIQPRLVEYLKTPPSANEIESIAAKLSGPADALARRKESYWQENGIDPKKLSIKKLAALIAANPILLERPVVVNENRAIVARPPEKVDELFD